MEIPIRALAGAVAEVAGVVVGGATGSDGEGRWTTGVVGGVSRGV